MECIVFKLLLLLLLYCCLTMEVVELSIKINLDQGSAFLYMETIELLL